jgi:hypothetical protein
MSPVSNRANAQRSTGPRTAAGKARSRFNALKHGLDAKEEILPGEDAEARAELSDAYREEHGPNGPTESYVVETLAHKDWERKRLLRIAAQVAHAIVDESTEGSLGTALLKDPVGAKLLDRVNRRLDAAHRAWMKALCELRRLRKEAHEEEAATPLDTPDERPTPIQTSDRDGAEEQMDPGRSLK